MPRPPCHASPQRWPRKGRITSLAVIDLDQIAGAADWARVVLGGGMGLSPYATFFVWLLFQYDYDAHRHRGVADQFLQHLNVRKWGSPSPSASNRSDSHGGSSGALAIIGRTRNIASKGCLCDPFHCKSGHKKSKHCKSKVIARQYNNYGYWNARGYASRGLFFR